MYDEWRPKVARVPALAWPVLVDPTGLTGPTRGQAAGRRWLRTSPRRYVDVTRRPDCVEQRILEAGVALRDGYVTGWAALRWAGAAFFDGIAHDGRTTLPVVLAANGERLRGWGGVTVVRDRAAPGEIHQRRGLRIARPERALLDELRGLDLPDAVAAIDLTTAAELTSNRRFRAYLATRPGARGSKAGLGALDRAVEGADSPQEVRFRLTWEDAGWGRPLVNRPIYDRNGRFVARPDLLDPVRGVVGEYQGAHHRNRARHARDVRRADDLRRLGLEYVEVVGEDLRDSALVLRRMREAADRARPERWTWVLGPEPISLDDVLDQRDALAALADRE